MARGSEPPEPCPPAPVEVGERCGLLAVVVEDDDFVLSVVSVARSMLSRH